MTMAETRMWSDRRLRRSDSTRMRFARSVSSAGQPPGPFRRRPRISTAPQPTRISATSLSGPRAFSTWPLRAWTPKWKAAARRAARTASVMITMRPQRVFLVVVMGFSRWNSRDYRYSRGLEKNPDHHGTQIHRLQGEPQHRRHGPSLLRRPRPHLGPASFRDRRAHD